MLTGVTISQDIQVHEEQSAPAPDASTDLLFISACIAVPVLWGLLVHRLFRYFRGRQADREWTDYQI